MRNKELLGTDDVILLLQAAVDQAGGQRAWGRKHKVSSAYISKVITRQKAPGDKITKALGLEVELRWRAPARS